MKTKIKTNFKAVEFMRQVRNEMSDIYHSDKQRYRDELKKSMADFIHTRAVTTGQKSVTASDAVH